MCVPAASVACDICRAARVCTMCGVSCGTAVSTGHAPASQITPASHSAMLFIAGILLPSTGAAIFADFIDVNCRRFVQLGSRGWFAHLSPGSVCDKYYGDAMSLSANGSWVRSTGGVGDVISCFKGSEMVYVWEQGVADGARYNQGLCELPATCASSAHECNFDLELTHVHMS